MKTLKRIIMVSFFILLASISFLQFTSSKYFLSFTQYLLTKVIGLNIEIKSLKRTKYLDFIATNVVLKDQLSNDFIAFENMQFSLNLFMPTRIRKIVLKNGKLNILQDDKNPNYQNILKQKEKNESNAINKGYSIRLIGDIVLDNFDVTYKDTSKELEILKSFHLNNAIINTTKQKDLFINSFMDNNQEKLNFIMSIENKVVYNDIKSELKSIKKYSEDKKLNLEFNISNFNIDKTLSQYINYNDLSILKGVATGTIGLFIEEYKKPVVSFYGNLNINNASLKYKEYKDVINNVDANVIFNKYKIDVTAKTNIKKALLNIDMSLDLLNSKLNMSLDTKKLDYNELKKYSLINNLNLDAKGYITTNLNLDIDFKENTKISLLGNAKSKRLEALGANLEDISLEYKMIDDTFYVNNFKSHLKYEKDKISVNTLANLDVKYNIKNRDGNLEYSLKNISGNINAQKISGNAKINKNIISNTTKWDDLVVKANYNTKNNILNVTSSGKNEKTIFYDNKEYKITPNINDLVYDTKNKQIKSLNTDVTLFGSTFKIKGSTNKDGNVNFDVDTKKIEPKELLKNLGVSSNVIDKANIGNVDLKVKLNGTLDNLNADFEISNKDFEGIFDYEDLYIKGKIQKKEGVDLDINLNLDEIWFKYHRLKNIQATIKKEEDVIKANVENENLNINFSYDTLNEDISLYANLDQYTIYNTFSPDINLLVNNFEVNIFGSLDNINGYVSLQNSPVIIEELNTGNVNLQAIITNNIVTIQQMSFRNSKISGNYYIDTNYLNLDAELKENDLENLFNIKDTDIDLLSKISITGSTNNLNVYTQTKLNNLKYKDIKIPNIDLSASLTGTDIKNIIKKGTFKIEDFKFYKDDITYINTQTEPINLETFNFKYQIEDKKIDLSKFDKKNKGIIELNTTLTGDFENIFGSISLNSEGVLIDGVKLEDMYVDAEASNEGININRIYFSYENNPLLVDGYASFKDLDYNFKLLADNVNFDFLKLYPYVNNASGVGNINIVFDKTNTQGDIFFEDFSLNIDNPKINIQNLVTDININNRSININQFTGLLNNGIIDFYGRFDIPEIPNDFMQSKRLKLGVIDLTLKADNVDLEYENIYSNISTNASIKENTVEGKLMLNTSKIASVPTFLLSNSKKTSKSYFSTILGEIIKNVYSQYNLDTELIIVSPINIDIKRYLIVKDIYGDVTGNLKFNFTNGRPLIDGKIDINGGKFTITNNLFNIENFALNVNGNTIEPTINFKATTNISSDLIQISLDGPINTKNLKFTSSEGKTQAEIIGLLAFNFDLNNLTKSIENNGIFGIIKDSNVLSLALETTLNEFLLTKVTDPIQSALGLSNFSVKTNFNSLINSLNISDFLKGTITTIILQKQLSSKGRVYINGELQVPLYFTNIEENILYNVWLSYYLKNGFSFNFGIKTTNYNILLPKNNNLAFYGGVDFSKKYYNWYEMLDDIKSIFIKPKEYKKESK